MKKFIEHAVFIAGVVGICLAGRAAAGAGQRTAMVTPGSAATRWPTTG